jgi:hypothetical protein
MRNLRLISTTAAILLLGAGAVSAENTIKTDETPGAPAAQQNAPPEKIAPAAKSDPIRAPEKTRQAVPTAPESANKQQTTDKAAPAGDAAKVSSDANRDVKSKRTERHVGGRYAGYSHGPLYNSYRGDGWYRGCHRHRLMPWLWC